MMFDLRKIFDLGKIFTVPKDFLKSKIYCTTNIAVIWQIFRKIARAFCQIVHTKVFPVHNMYFRRAKNLSNDIS